MNQKTLFLIAVALLVAGFLTAVMVYQGVAPGGTGKASVAERIGAPIKGPQDAPVTIVEFFDPACGTCAQFYPMLEQLVKQYDGQVRVMLRYAPLHAGSDQVVTLLEAAHRQGKFFQALETLFASQSRWVANHQSQPAAARAILKSIAMDHGQLELDAAGAEVAAVVVQDVADAQALGVKATPEFFVNGKPLPSWGWEQLQALVRETVEDLR